MPYIAAKDREKYDPLIMNAVRLFDTDVPITTAQFYGYFAFTLCRQYLRNNKVCWLTDTAYIRHSPRDMHIHPDIILSIDGLAADLLELLQPGDPPDNSPAGYVPLDADLETHCGEINYILSSVKWGLLGDVDGIREGRYCLRTFLKGALHWVLTDYLPHCRDVRFYIMLQGVLTDVIDEAYRRRTAVYENRKIDENGDLWNV